MADRGPEPTSGQRAEGPGGYQRKAGRAGGKSRSPVLNGDSLTGRSGFHGSPLA